MAPDGKSQIIVTATLCGNELRCLIDTGASVSYISEDFVRATVSEAESEIFWTV
eukprot:SAG31_NODE_863_length_11394_cov_8.226737_2_plen_54_part_00